LTRTQGLHGARRARPQPLVFFGQLAPHDLWSHTTGKREPLEQNERFRCKSCKANPVLMESGFPLSALCVGIFWRQTGFA
jgi:hypothetical protein